MLFLKELEIVKRFPISPACPDPRPGRNEQSGADRSEARSGFLNLINGFVIICSGIFVLFFIDLIIIDEPNNPVNRGSNG